jgi:hypothetical protein
MLSRHSGVVAIVSQAVLSCRSMRIAIAALLLASLPAIADHACPPGHTPHHEAGAEMCVRTTVSCVPPLLWRCEGSTCACRPTRPRMLCQVSISWPEGDPSAGQLVLRVEELPPWCDRAGAELAVAAALARMLGAPPYP